VTRRRTATLALDGAPPISLGLRRFVLRSVGPPAARFHPLDLDLVTPDDTVARRALCVLTNTGGKSTLLKLLSSVVNPGTTSLIGKGGMADMVLATDTSHVVLEWQEADGSRFVTGWSAQWDGLQKPQTGTKGLRQCWYTFRVGRFGIDDLPFEHDGRRVRWDEYQRQLRALFGEYPTSAGLIADTQTDWRRTLAQRTHIDSELFMYQARMNAAESGAAALVTRLKTPEAVVGFFVEAFDDDTRTADMFHQVDAYIRQAAGRKTMEVHADLCAELVEALTHFGNENGNHLAALDMERLEIELQRELAGAVQSRATVEAARAAEAAEALEAENARLAATNRAIDGDEDRRKQYLYLEAEMRRDAALAAELEAESAALQTDLRRDAWAAVPAVQAHDRASAAHRQAQAAFDAAETELAPLRQQVELSASRLVAGLNAQAASAATAAQEAGRRVEEAREAQRLAAGRRDAAIRAGARLDAELRAADQRVRRAEQLLADARRSGDVAASETASDASTRWLGVRDTSWESRRLAAGERERARRAHHDAERSRGVAEITRREAETAVRGADETLAQAAASVAGLLANPEMAAVAGATSEEVPPHRAVPAAVAASAAVTVDGQAEAVERSAADTYADLRSVEEELERLADTDLLDAGEEVAKALGVLREARIGSLTGWGWLESMVAPEDRLAFIAARPDIANGVVVNDPARLDDARKALEKAGLLPRLAVAVTTSRAANSTADALPGVDAVPGRFVVEPHPGLYDKDKAEEEIRRLEERRDLLSSRLAEQTARGRELRDAASFARRHAETWPERRIAEVEAQRSAAELRRQEAAEREAEASADLRDAARVEEAATTCERSAAEQERGASAAWQRLVRAVEAESAAAAHLVARPGIVEQMERHESETRLAAQDVASADAQAQMAAAEQRESEGVGRTAREKAAQIGAAPAAKVPPEPVHVLDAQHSEVSERLANEAAGRDHYGTLERATEALTRAAEPLTAFGEEVLGLTRQLADSVLAGSPDAVRSQAVAAVEAWKMAVNRTSLCRRDVEQWSKTAEIHRPTDRVVHATLRPDEVPADADDAARRATELIAQLLERRALRDRQQAARDAAAQAKVAAAEAAGAFGRLLSPQDGPVAGAEPYPGHVDSAKADLDERRKAVEYAKDLVSEARVNRQEATNGVNKRASDKRWGDITDSLKELCVTASADTLADHGPRFLEGLRTREASLRADIAELDTHRSAVIDSLGQTCDQLQRSLRRVKSASTIPANVFGVGGQQAIMIDFKRLPPEAANAALSETVNEWAASGADVHDAKARQARLMQALSVTVERRPEAGRWSVKLLKPRIDGDVTYCSPDRVSREYSGGQELTLAVLLYCTLAAVRADDRGGSDRPPGLLLLDNPFGAASSERLIQMQQELAAAADVQLFCFTALSEPSILNGFNGPGTFRQTLRNDRDQRNGHQHVRAIGAGETVQRRVAVHLAGPDLEAGEESRVSGVAYQTKPPFPAEPPVTMLDGDG